MIDQQRLEGDIKFFLTGDTDLLVPSSIYRRLQKKDGILRDVYSQLIGYRQDKQMMSHTLGFSQFASKKNLGYRPCISVIHIGEGTVRVKFRVVDPEQFPYDIACVQALYPNHKIKFEGVIKEFKDDQV